MDCTNRLFNTNGVVVALVRVVLTSVFSMFVSACQPRVNLRGNLSLEEKIGTFKVGKTTNDDVYRACGSPNLQRGDRIWIYVSARSEETAFRRVEVKSKLVVRLVFDEGGTLKRIEKVFSGKSASAAEELDSDITELRKK